MRRRQPSTAITNTVGNIHTQWCDHDTGETTKPNSAIQITAIVDSPARSTRRVAHSVSASTSRHAATHGRNRACSLRPSRASAPAMFWLVFKLAAPIRSVLWIVLVQYRQESCQARANPASVAARKDASDVNAARLSRFSRKYSRNTAGVSLSAMPSPSSRPRGHAVRRGTQSAITSVISTTLICPKAKFALIGSSQIAAAATISVVNNHRRSQAGPGATRALLHTSSRVSRIIVETSSSANVISVIVTLATGRPNQAKGQNTMAASGG